MSTPNVRSASAVKWRTISGSASSGRRGGRERRSVAGSSGTGRSGRGGRPARRPARDAIRHAREHGVHPGYALGRDYEGMDDVLLVAVTEKKSVEDVDRLAEVLAEVCG